VDGTPTTRTEGTDIRHFAGAMGADHEGRLEMILGFARSSKS
jgi:hypothetical protein